MKYVTNINEAIELAQESFHDYMGENMKLFEIHENKYKYSTIFTMPDYKTDSLDDAIKHAIEKSKNEHCKECAKDHAQLALWLKELKSYRQTRKLLED